ncbi:MAG TPA: hypothetical protein DDZ51_23130 [Planctomycetaceae bacterium]|nr:hypothetical protein [Planctomycetaceae bacterium]
MVASANINRCSRRSIVVAWLFAATFLSGASLTAEKAEASCGDYLLHGPVHSPATSDQPELQINYGLGSSSNQRTLDTDQSPTPVKSPCASGRCHSAPPHPPANSPTRAVYIKQPVVVDAFKSLNSDRDAVDWLYPADGLRPEGPSLAVDLPPPERAC